MAFIGIGTVIGTVVRQNSTTDPSPDVSIVPYPNWANITNDQRVPSYTVAVQRIQGIGTTITLQVDKTAGTMKVYRRVDTTLPTWTNGGSWDGNVTGWTEITSYPHTFTVTNNQYVSFGCVQNGVDASSSLTITNVSDGNLPLDTITATVFASGAVDNIPNPTPNWDNISLNEAENVYIAAVQQIQGITGNINLSISKFTVLGDCIVYYRISSTAPSFINGGLWDGNTTGWTEILDWPVTINVKNNEYLQFGCNISITNDAQLVVSVRNASDSNTLLDTFDVTISPGGTPP